MTREPAPPAAGQIVLGPWAIGALLLGALVLTYAVVIVTPYAVTDDYFHLANSIRGPRTLARGFMTSLARGCVTSAGMTILAFRAAGDLEGLRYVRLFAVIGVAVVAFLLYRAMIRAGWSGGRAVCLAFLVCTTPPFQVCVSWSLMFTTFYSCALTGLACHFSLRFIESPLQERRRWRLLAAAIGLLFLAVTIYQVTLMFFVVFCAIDLFRADEPERFWRRVFWHAVVMGAGLALGFLAFEVGVAFYGQYVNSARTHVMDDVLGKLSYFYEGPLKTSLHLDKLTPMAYLPLLVAVLGLTGLYLYFRGSRRSRLLRVGLALALIPAIYLPNLMTAENWGAYRTQIGLTALMMLYAFLALHGLVRRWREGRGERALNYVLPVATVLAGLLAASNVTRYYAEPQMAEIRIMREQIARIDLPRVRKIHVVPSSWEYALNGALFDEFGLPSSSQPWSTVNMVYVLAAERMPKKPRFPILIAEKPFKLPSGEWLINMTRLEKFR